MKQHKTYGDENRVKRKEKLRYEEQGAWKRKKSEGGRGRKASRGKHTCVWRLRTEAQKEPRSGSARKVKREGGSRTQAKRSEKKKRQEGGAGRTGLWLIKRRDALEGNTSKAEKPGCETTGDARRRREGYEQEPTRAG